MRVKFDLHKIANDEANEVGMFNPKVSMNDIDLNRVYERIKKGISEGEDCMISKDVNNKKENKNDFEEGNTVINLETKKKRKMGSIAKIAIAAACIGIAVGGITLLGNINKKHQVGQNNIDKTTDKSEETVYTFIKGKGIYDNIDKDVYDLKDKVVKESGDYRYTIGSAYADKDGVKFDIYISQISQDGTGYDINPDENQITEFVKNAGLTEFSDDGLSGNDKVLIEYNGEEYTFDGNYSPDKHTSVYTTRTSDIYKDFLDGRDNMSYSSFVLSVNMDFKDNINATSENNLPSISDLVSDREFKIVVLGQEFDVELEKCEQVNDLSELGIIKTNDVYSFLPVITQNKGAFELELYTFISGQTYENTTIDSLMWLDVNGEKVKINTSLSNKTGYNRYTGKTDLDLTKAKLHIANTYLEIVLNKDCVFDFSNQSQINKINSLIDNKLIKIKNIEGKVDGKNININYEMSTTPDIVSAELEIIPSETIDSEWEIGGFIPNAETNVINNGDGTYTTPFKFNNCLPTKGVLLADRCTIVLNEEKDEVIFNQDLDAAKNAFVVDCVTK